MTSCSEALLESRFVQAACCQTRAWQLYGAAVTLSAITLLVLGLLGKYDQIQFLTSTHVKYFIIVGAAVGGAGLLTATALLVYQCLCKAGPQPPPKGP